MRTIELQRCIQMVMLDLVARDVRLVRPTLPPAHSCHMLRWIRAIAEAPRGHPPDAYMCEPPQKVTTAGAERDLLKRDDGGRVWRRYAPAGESSAGRRRANAARERFERLPRGRRGETCAVDLVLALLADRRIVNFDASPMHPRDFFLCLDHAVEAGYISLFQYFDLRWRSVLVAVVKGAVTTWLRDKCGNASAQETELPGFPTVQDIVPLIELDASAAVSAEDIDLLRGLSGNMIDPQLQARILATISPHA